MAIQEQTSPDGPAQTPAEQSTPPSVRTAAPGLDAVQKPRLPFPVVAIGGSAGGLEAFLEFFEALPADPGMSFVLIQHLPAHGESLLAEIIRKRTPLTVHEVEDGTAIQPNHVYTIRPGKTLTIEHGHLHLGERLEKPGRNHPVDDFFRSLAEEQRERAIVVIMSGMGSNGSAGAQIIKAVGGLCIAQDPATAKYPSMPVSVIEAGYADYILSPAEIPAALFRYAQHPYATGKLTEESLQRRDNQIFKEIITLLRTRTRHEFAGYKRPTLFRRIQRRMGLNQVVELPEYVQLLRQRPAEAQALADDMLIHVTGFFRDNEAWEALQKQVIVPIVQQRENQSPIRAWVSACSSGEEAYSLAMLVIEAAEAVHKKFDVKIFATDTADRALGLARAGVYPGGIEAEIRPDRVERFFEKSESAFHICKEIREMVVFAPHDVLHDPPFSQLDLITCRNLLIYLEPEIQKRLLALFHFGLKPGGNLFLGTSETVAGDEDLFEPIDKHWRLYRRRESTRRRVPILPVVQHPEGRLSGRQSPRAYSVTQLAQRKLLEDFTPPSILVDREHHVLYLHGNTDQFITLPPGEPTREVLTLLRENVRGAARNALQQAAASGKNISVRGGILEDPAGRRRIIVTVAPVEQKAGPPCFLISFREELEEAPAPRPAPKEASPDLELLEDELQRTREELQNAIQELQAANEELKASNEETSSVNEELQSTNEELETGKEELQSLNEELSTVNAQLHAKMDDLQNATNDLEFLLSSADIGVIFLDTKLRIRRFTPAVSGLMDLLPSDIGRPFADLARKFDDPDIIRDSQQVLKKLIPLGKSVASTGGRWYQRKILPFRTADNRIEGVVITFVDISEFRKVEETLRASAERTRILLESLQEHAVFFLDDDGKILAVNSTARKVFGYSSDEIIGKPFSTLYAEKSREGGAAETDLNAAREAGTTATDRAYVRADGSNFIGTGILASVQAAEKGHRSYVHVIAAPGIHKGTGSQGAENLSHGDVDARDQFLAVLGHELRTPLTAILLWAKMLQRGQAGDQTADAIEVILRGAEAQKQLIDDMLDMSKMRSGRVRLNMRPTRLAEIIKGAVESLRPAVEAKSLVLDTQLDPAVGTVRADPDRIQQVIWNLLSNAAKFSPPHSHIKVQLKRIDGHVAIIVADHGSGIPPEFFPHIFQPFRQAEETPTRQGGLGLGLAICKQLVELHGGTIVAQSTPGQGSTFIVRLPLPSVRDTSPHTKDHLSSGEPSDSFLRGRSVLLVEDEPDSRNALATMLRLAGGNVSAHAAPASALPAIADNAPDIILSDISMPGGIDGIEFIRRVRTMENEKKRPHIPALALTAFGADEDFRLALGAGFNAYLVKPVNPEALLSTLRDIL